MSEWFHVGQKVVCIRDEWDDCRSPLEKGRVYTIVAIGRALGTSPVDGACGRYLVLELKEAACGRMNPAPTIEHLTPAEYRKTAKVRVMLSDMPPSANGLRKSFVKSGKVMSVKTDQYAAWREAALLEIKGQKPGRIEGPYSLSIAAQRHWRSKRARDIDNIIKPVSDALVKAGIVTDDSLAESVSAKWADDLGGPAVVVIVQEAMEALAA